MSLYSYRLASGRVVRLVTAADVRAAGELAHIAKGSGAAADDARLRAAVAERASELGLELDDGGGIKGLSELAAFDVTRVDGVATPANGAPILLAKSARGARAAKQAPGVVGRLIKSDGERRYTLTVAYPANKPDVAVALDQHRDFAGPAALEDAAWAYLTKSPQVGLWHEDGTEGAGQVVESYIYRGPDWVVKSAGASEYTVRSGDWLLGVVWSPETWGLIKSGEIGGVSPQGRAQRRVPSAQALAGLHKSAARDGLLAKAAAYKDKAMVVTDPALRNGYFQLAAQLRQEAGAA